jgi:hypothetical protein
MTYIAPGSTELRNAVAKNISANGLSFETRDASLKESCVVELKLDIEGAPNAVHAKGTVVWRRKLSLEDAAPYDVGIEVVEIEEDNKNTFLKFLCDQIYNLREESKNAAN